MKILRKRYYCEVAIGDEEIEGFYTQTTTAHNKRWYEIAGAVNAMDATEAMVGMLEKEEVVGIVKIRIWTAIKARTKTTLDCEPKRPWRRRPTAIDAPDRTKPEEWKEVGEATIIC